MNKQNNTQYCPHTQSIKSITGEEGQNKKDVLTSLKGKDSPWGCFPHSFINGSDSLVPGHSLWFEIARDSFLFSFLGAPNFEAANAHFTWGCS